MLDFYDNVSATRAVSTFLTAIEQDKVQLSQKDILVLTLISYKGVTCVPFLSKVFGCDVTPNVKNLEKFGVAKVARKEGATKYYECTLLSTSSDVFSEDSMYIFANALFNIGKYVKEYEITSWSLLLSIVELPLHLTKETSHVKLTLDSLKTFNGVRNNRLIHRRNLEKIGVTKAVDGKTPLHTDKPEYRLNKHAYLMGAI